MFEAILSGCLFVIAGVLVILVAVVAPVALVVYFTGSLAGGLIASFLWTLFLMGIFGSHP